MPEPDPYYDSDTPSPRPSHNSTDSYGSSTGSSDLLRKVTTGSIGNRRLLVQGSTNGSQGGRSAAYGLPSSVRPPSRPQTAIPSRSSGSSLDSPSSTTSRNHAGRNSPRPSTNGTGGSPSSREPLNQPPSVFTPGHKYGASDTSNKQASRSFEIYDNRPNALDEYQSRLAGSNQYNQPIPRTSDTLGVPASTNRRPSQERLRDHSENRLSPAGSNASAETVSLRQYTHLVQLRGL